MRGHLFGKKIELAAIGRSWAALGPLLGCSWAALGPLLGRSWAALGPLLGRSWAALGPLLADVVVWDLMDMQSRLANVAFVNGQKNHAVDGYQWHMIDKRTTLREKSRGLGASESFLGCPGDAGRAFLVV